MNSRRDELLENKYNDTVTFLCSLERFGILLGLENITYLLEQLGNPQKKFPAIHVAGSNGKGSTSAFIFGILREAGYNAALYTSPHLNDFRERIRVNGSLISKEALIEITERIRRIYSRERTTFFEFTTAVAFDYIAQIKPDIAVIEVGLGGRLDATNTIEPLVTVITDISREHEDYLGTGIAAVATEKAGVIKSRIPLITGAARSEARRVIIEAASNKSAPVREFGRNFSAKKTGASAFSYTSDKLHLDEVHLQMPGSHQMKNAALAIAVIEELRDQGYEISELAIENGIRKTVFPGRFEILQKRPDIIIDGAHTPEGMRLLKSTFKRLYPGAKPLLLLGMLKDKSYQRLIDIIAPIAREVVCVPPQGTRALDPDELAQLIRNKGISVTSAQEITEGLQIILKKADKNDVVLAAGSLYMIGPVRSACGFGED